MSNPDDRVRGKRPVFRLAALLLIVAGGARAAELAFDIRIARGRVPDAVHLIRVHEGDSVTLRWTSDRPVILHLHGYDIEKPVAAGAVTEFSFTAYATGRFPIEIHTPGTGAGGAAHEEEPLAVIEVYPQ